MSKNPKVALAGCGNFGKKILDALYKCKLGVVYVCDSDINQQYFSGIREPSLFTTDYNSILNSKDVDIVFIATPAQTHFELAKKALLVGKHVFLEKPLTLNLKDAEALRNLKSYELNDLYLHVDNTFCYSKEVNFLKQIIDLNYLGRPIHFQSVRANWGPFLTNIDVVFDLLPHDLSILEYLFPTMAIGEVIATGEKIKNAGIIDEAYVHFGRIMDYNGNCMTANICVSWHKPTKIREIIITFENGTVYTNTASDDFLFQIADSDNKIIKVFQQSEITELASPLEVEIKHFINCIKNQKSTLSNLALTVNQIEIMEKVVESINTGRKMIICDNPF